MGFRGRLEITDGTTFIDLLGNSGGSKSIFGLLEWEPAAPDVKDGGIWMDNPLLDGRQLAIRKESNIIETFSLVAKGQNATDVLNAITRLRYMLNRAVGYWTNRARYPDPIYLLIQYPEETVPYWALIYDYRLPQITNPYVQPMYGKKVAAIPEFTLVIERGMRSPITGKLCNPFDIDYELSPDILSGIFSPSISQDDATVNWTTQALVLNDTLTLLGLGASGEQGYTGRFRNITIPPGSIITRAYLSLTPGGSSAIKPAGMYIATQLNVAPAQFANWADWVGRTWSAEVHLESKDINTTWITDTPGAKLTNAGGWEGVLQQVIDLPGWASGNDIAFYIRNYELSNDYSTLKSLYTVDNGTAAWNPYLFIEWIRPVHEINNSNNDCTPIVIGNKDPFNSIGNILVYDLSGGTYTDKKNAALPWTLLPAVPAVNDALYIACNFVDDDPQDMPFNSLVFNLSTAAVGGLIAWQYWNGAAWTALTVNDLTSSLHLTGQTTLHWTSPTNWAKNAVNGITAFWIRGLVSAAPTVAPIQATKLYQSLRPYIDVLLQTYEFPLKYKLQINPLGSLGGSSDYSIDHAFICSRLKARGEHFTPFLNLADTLFTLPDNIMLSHPLGTDTQLNTAPTGRAIRYNPGGVVVETNAFTFAIHSAISAEYSGKFRVFLRRYGATTPENILYRLTVSNNPSGVSSNYYITDQIVDTNNPSYSLIDFGTVDLTAFAMDYNDFYLTVSSQATGAADVYWVDLILLPVDDAMVEIYQRIGSDVTAWLEGYYNRLTTIDSTVGDEEQAYMEDNGNIITKLLFNSNSDVTIPVNREMRIWFFFGCYKTGCTNYQRRYHPGIIAGITLQILPEKI